MFYCYLYLFIKHLIYILKYNLTCNLNTTFNNKKNKNE